MAARFTRLLVTLGLLLGAALPSAAAAVVRLPTSQEIAASPVPGRGAGPAYARSYFGARYYRADTGRFTTIDPVTTIEENLLDPQRWNRYVYARNNPLRWMDPTGEEIAVSANEGERARLESDTRKALGDAGQYVNIEWNDSAKRWQYVVSGIGMDQFKGINEAAGKFGDLVASSALVWVKVTSERLPKDDVGFTFDVGTRGGNKEPVVALNYNRETAMVEGSQSLLFISNNFGDVSPGVVRPLTMGITLMHELGHAWGNIHGRRTEGAHTWQEAVDWENAARRATYPIGPNAMRRWHR